MHKVLSSVQKPLILKIARPNYLSHISSEKWDKSVRLALDREFSFLKEVPADFKKIQRFPYATFVTYGERVGYLAKNYGENLSKYNNVEPSLKLSITNLVLEGLKELNLMNAFHLDITTNNILVRMKNGKPKVKFIDFGLGFVMKETLPEELQERKKYILEFDDCLNRSYNHIHPQDRDMAHGLMMKKDFNQDDYQQLLALVRSIHIFAVGALLFEFGSFNKAYNCYDDQYLLKKYVTYTPEQMENSQNHRLALLTKKGYPEALSRLIVKMIHPWWKQRATIADIEVLN